MITVTQNPVLPSKKYEKNVSQTQFERFVLGKTEVTRLASDRETTDVIASLLTCKTNHKSLLRFVEHCFYILLKMNRGG